MSKRPFVDDRKDTSWVMPKAKRLEWIMAYFNAPNRPRHFYENALNQDFVDDYTKATNAPYMIYMVGANRCPTLGRDLAALYRAGKLARSTGGTGNMRSMGFPSWTWMYRLPEVRE